MDFRWIFKNDNYVVTRRKPRRIRQPSIPKPPPDHNGSKSIPGKHEVKFVKAKNLDKS